MYNVDNTACKNNINRSGQFVIYWNILMSVYYVIGSNVHDCDCGHMNKLDGNNKISFFLGRTFDTNIYYTICLRTICVYI